MLRIAVQSKGRLYDETMMLLEEAGIKLNIRSLKISTMILHTTVIKDITAYLWSPFNLLLASLHLGPVSYTHLDVYKRQPMDLYQSCFFFLSFILSTHLTSICCFYCCPEKFCFLAMISLSLIHIWDWFSLSARWEYLIVRARTSWHAVLPLFDFFGAYSARLWILIHLLF